MSYEKTLCLSNVKTILIDKRRNPDWIINTDIWSRSYI